MPHHLLPPTRTGRTATGLLGLLLGVLTLSGCGPRSELPTVLYLTIGSSDNEAVDADLIEGFRQRLDSLESGYRELQPATRFQVSVESENDVVSLMRRRTGAGLGPDLLLINGDTARQLLEAGLVDPYPINSSLRNSLDAGHVRELSDSQGRLAGLPVLLQTQVACFNRKRLKRAPATLNELLNAGASGHPIGLSVQLADLFWSAGGFGAVKGLEQGLEGRPWSKPQAQAIVNWLDWLQDANNQRGITVYSNQSMLEADFLAGRLDWLPCRSIALPKLRQRLGADLGIAPLPDGSGGRASPINRLRVLSLGRSSSPQGRARALAFGHHALTPLSQRMLTLGSMTVLPANRFVTVPVNSSATLAALVSAEEHGLQSESIIRMVHASDPRVAQAQAVLTRVVFGEITPQEGATNLLSGLQAKP